MLKHAIIIMRLSYTSYTVTHSLLQTTEDEIDGTTANSKINFIVNYLNK